MEAAAMAAAEVAVEDLVAVAEAAAVEVVEEVDVKSPRSMPY